MNRLSWYVAFMCLSWTIVLAMCSCIEKWDAVDPKSQQPVAGNPCGPLWFPCFDMNGLQNGACCSDGETCGGSKWSVGCPADSCCDIREIPEELRSGDAAPPLAGPRFVVKHPQRHLESK